MLLLLILKNINPQVTFFYFSISKLNSLFTMFLIFLNKINPSTLRYAIAKDIIQEPYHFLQLLIVFQKQNQILLQLAPLSLFFLTLFNGLLINYLNLGKDNHLKSIQVKLIHLQAQQKCAIFFLMKFMGCLFFFCLDSYLL